MMFLIILLAGIAKAEKIGLKEAILLAHSGNGELKSQQIQMGQAAEDLNRVYGEFGPKVEALVGIGPTTKITGNLASSEENKNSLGRMILGKISVVQPLITWGRKSSYTAAAQAGIAVKQAELDAKAEDITYQVKEAYYGYQYANSLLDFVSSGRADFEKSNEDRKKKKQTAAKENYKLDILLRKVEEKEAEIKKGLELAKEGFALRVGRERNSVMPKDEWLILEPREKKSIDFYVKTARENRSEFKQLREGILAKKSLAMAEKKADLPVLGLFGSYEMADTNNRTHQPGYFAYDPYNRDAWAFGVGFKWDFQWGLQAAKSAKFRLEASELEEKQAYANRGIESDVHRAFLEVEEAETKYKAAYEAYKTGKKWLTGELMAYGSGLGAVDGLVEAYGARADTVKAYFEAIYQLDLAWAGLSKAVGKEIDPLLE